MMTKKELSTLFNGLNNLCLNLCDIKACSGNNCSVCSIPSTMQMVNKLIKNQERLEAMKKNN